MTQLALSLEVGVAILILFLFLINVSSCRDFQSRFTTYFTRLGTCNNFLGRFTTRFTRLGAYSNFLCRFTTRFTRLGAYMAPLQLLGKDHCLLHQDVDSQLLKPRDQYQQGILQSGHLEAFPFLLFFHLFSQSGGGQIYLGGVKFI